MLKRDFEMLKYAYSAWKRSTFSNIESAYKTKPSIAKIDAFNYIWAESKRLKSVNLKVVHASCFTFTCGYTFFNADGNEIFVYHLPTRVLNIPVSEVCV